MSMVCKICHNGNIMTSSLSGDTCGNTSTPSDTDPFHLEGERDERMVLHVLCHAWQIINIMHALFCRVYVCAFASLGSKLQPWVQFQRRALSLPSNATYTNLTAFLTVSSSTQDTQYFPYLQGLHPNYTGNTRETKF